SAPGDDPEGPYTHTYDYDEHGSMTAMPHLSSMVWNHDDELREVTVGTETVSFQYAGGIRSRKYTQKSGAITEERIYLGAFEIYRKRSSGSLTLERESLHISDGTGRICIVETKTVGTGSPAVVWRYQLGNHLGSAATEVDEDGEVISYEEYHPYGTSAYRAVDSSVEVSAKRYRYTGMERDEETGLSYHSARYYVPWLGRWSAADPGGLVDGPGRYSYARNSPTRLNDPSGRRADPTEDEIAAMSDADFAAWMNSEDVNEAKKQHVTPKTAQKSTRGKDAASTDGERNEIVPSNDDVDSIGPVDAVEEETDALGADAPTLLSPEPIDRPAGLDDLAEGMQENREELEAAKNVLNKFREGAEFVLENALEGMALRIIGYVFGRIARASGVERSRAAGTDPTQLRSRRVAERTGKRRLSEGPAGRGNTIPGTRPNILRNRSRRRETRGSNRGVRQRHQSVRHTRRNGTA
ncbi:MAG: RHS repeat-associated core domain-containing protein, partial [Enhygromyxa sp.]